MADLSKTAQSHDTRGITLYEGSLQFPDEPCTSSYRVLVRASRSGGLPVALIEDTVENGGMSAHFRFDEIVRTVRAKLPPDTAEPIWVQRWAARAVASWLLGRADITSDQLMIPMARGWWKQPIPAAVTSEMLSV